MMRARFLLVTSLLLVGTLALAVPAQDDGDVIYKTDGTTLPRPGGKPIKIIKESFSEVEYKMEGLNNVLRLPSRDVADIKYYRMPEEYKAGLMSIREGLYDQAIGDFNAALDRGRGYHWLVPNALYRIAICHMNMGRYGEANKAFRRLLIDAPETRFFSEAWLGIIKCTFLASGARGEKSILSAINEFEHAIKKRNLGNNYQHKIKYWKLRLLDARGKEISEDAKKLSIDAAQDDPATANRAKLLIGQNYLNQDNVAKAREFFQGVGQAASITEYDVKAGAYAGLGECLFKSGSEDDKKVFNKAREYFLRALVMSDSHPDKVEREIAVRSLYFAGRCFAILRGESPHNGRYARDMFREILQNYAGTEWAEKANNELKKL
jgi:tetratricopeptide (TPR) repeat protein